MGDQGCSAAGDDGVLGDDLGWSGGACAPAHFFPAALSVSSGMNPEWAQDTGDASHLSLPWLPPGMLPPGMLSAICRCVPPWDTPAPSWEQAGMMGTRIVGTRELTPALRKLVSESRALLDILLILTNWH